MEARGNERHTHAKQPRYPLFSPSLIRFPRSPLACVLPSPQKVCSNCVRFRKGFRSQDRPQGQWLLFVAWLQVGMSDHHLHAARGAAFWVQRLPYNLHSITFYINGCSYSTGRMSGRERLVFRSLAITIEASYIEKVMDCL